MRYGPRLRTLVKPSVWPLPGFARLGVSIFGATVAGLLVAARSFFTPRPQRTTAARTEGAVPAADVAG